MRILCIVALLVQSGSVAAAPLFESEEILAITIEAPMRDLIRKRAEKREYPAVVRYVDGDGLTGSLDATISPRGNSRLEACEFPPLWLEFDRKQVTGTPFEGQHRLKLVTQCNRGSRAGTWLLLEYGLYRAYNAVSTYSYRVRKLDVTYQDTTTSRWQRNTPAFVIEPTSQVAERHNRVSVRPPGVKPEQLEKLEATKNMLFQFLIANTDFSMKRGPQGEGCCHNGRVLATAGAEDNWIVLPYDFDQAGIISTDYALPDARLGIRRVSSRLYRGFCWQNEALPEAIAVFNENRDEISLAITAEVAAQSQRGRVQKYIDDFYGIINDPRELDTQLIAKCRGVASFPVRKTVTAAHE